MADKTVSTVVNSFMYSADAPAARAAIGAAGATQAINDQTGSSTYTFVLADAQKLVLGHSNGIFTIPAHASVAYPVGTWIEVSCASSTQSDSLNVVAAGGVTFTWSGGNSSGLYAWGSQTVKLRNTAVNVWEATLYPFFAPGIVKSDAFFNIEVAVPGTDYLSPGGVTLQNTLTASSITPAADGTYTPVTSITIVSGIITSIS